MARLVGRASLMEGVSISFQVESNKGTQIAIRPFAIDGAGANYTLMQALSAAGLSAQPEYLSMVDRMMEEQMPIDRESLQQMAPHISVVSFFLYFLSFLPHSAVSGAPLL